MLQHRNPYLSLTCLAQSSATPVKAILNYENEQGAFSCTNKVIVWGHKQFAGCCSKQTINAVTGVVL